MACIPEPAPAEGEELYDVSKPKAIIKLASMMTGGAKAPAAAMDITSLLACESELAAAMDPMDKAISIARYITSANQPSDKMKSTGCDRLTAASRKLRDVCSRLENASKLLKEAKPAGNNECGNLTRQFMRAKEQYKGNLEFWWNKELKQLRLRLLVPDVTLINHLIGSEHDFGSFIVHLMTWESKEDHYLRFYAADSKHFTGEDDGYIHPHIYGNGGACRGALGHYLYKTMPDKRYADALNCIEAFIRSYHETQDYAYYSIWKRTPSSCPKCKAKKAKVVAVNGGRGCTLCTFKSSSGGWYFLDEKVEHNGKAYAKSELFEIEGKTYAPDDRIAIGSTEIQTHCWPKELIEVCSIGKFPGRVLGTIEQASEKVSAYPTDIFLIDGVPVSVGCLPHYEAVTGRKDEKRVIQALKDHKTAWHRFDSGKYTSPFTKDTASAYPKQFATC